MSAVYMEVHLRLDFFHGSKQMSSDQTVLWEQSDLVPSCLQYRLPKNISR